MKTETDHIECEEVVLKIPKVLMLFLREHEDVLGEKTEDYLQRSIVGLVRADIETNNVFVPSPIELANKYNLQPIFKTFDIEIFYVDS
jgi:hypothetical protein